MEFLSLLIVSILVWNSSGAELWSHLRNQKQAVRAKAADIKLYLYTNENTQGEEVLSIENLDDLINSNYYNHSLKNIFIMHGWTGTILNDVNIETKAAIFESGKSANIFVVDWSIPAGLFYPLAVWSIPSVGQIIANYIDEMINHFGIDGSDFILVGHSIGAHLAGVVGSNLNGTIGQIVGLEPVWILFSANNLAEILDKTDAAVVHIVHTTRGFGISHVSTGHADFYFNGAIEQPGCVDSGCAHARACAYYAESIVSSGFKALKCSSYEEFQNGDCSGNQEVIFGGYPLDGSISGDFHLDTAEVAPFALG